jgi:hypothetical protein
MPRCVVDVLSLEVPRHRRCAASIIHIMSMPLHVNSIYDRLAQSDLCKAALSAVNLTAVWVRLSLYLYDV